MDEGNIRIGSERTSENRTLVKRAVYNDHTAWLMSIFSEIAYTPFKTENEAELLDLASDLAIAAGRTLSKQGLKQFRSLLAGHGSNEEALLESILAIGGFELAGTLHDYQTDTQGFVTVSRSPGTGLIAVCFTGTNKLHDWLTSLELGKEPVSNKHCLEGAVLGTVHRGFHHAYKSVHSQLTKILKGTDRLPVYLTGHSLGGALATLAAWYLPGERLAACYTFGAPRVGDKRLADKYRIPIYRVVNTADPIPRLPLVGWKILLRSLTRLVAPFPVFDRLTRMLLRKQGYGHFGQLRRLSRVDPEPGESAPSPQHQNRAGETRTLKNVAERLSGGKLGWGLRVFENHHIANYRVRLRERALHWQIQH